MALVGPIYQGARTAIVDDRGFSQLGVLCYIPIHMSTESWDYEVIKRTRELNSLIRLDLW